MREMPFWGACVGHGLHTVILNEQRIAKSFGMCACFSKTRDNVRHALGDIAKVGPEKVGRTFWLKLASINADLYQKVRPTLRFSCTHALGRARARDEDLSRIGGFAIAGCGIFLGKVVEAICHGVVLAARSKRPLSNARGDANHLEREASCCKIEIKFRLVGREMRIDL